jgi:hypothetical protein
VESDAVLVYPKKRLEARKAILEALKEHKTPETGIGYNILFDKVSGTIGSRSTFDKYLSELQRDSLVDKIMDYRHKKGVIIHAQPSADYELQTIQLIEELKRIFNRKNMKSVVSERDVFDKKTLRYNVNIRMVSNCIYLAHKTLAEMVPKIAEKFGDNPFIKTTETDGNIQIDIKNTNED